jgi:catechol 2,3-dioxygenase-like lactoylglutathione lyase family enzyme
VRRPGLHALIYLLALLCNWASAGDALAPTSDPKDALVSALQRITISTNSLAESKLFYVDALGLSMEGPRQLTKRQRRFYQMLWQLKADEPWQLYRLYRAGAQPANSPVAEIDLVVFARTKPPIHASWSALELGPLSLGFPNSDQIAQDKAVRALGFGALNSLEIYPVPRPDGSTYAIQETIFNGPDFVHAVGIHRADGMSQLGALDARGLGGPAYCAQIVDDSERMIAFMRDVLGWEMRSDRQWKSAGSKGALNVPDGTAFRFSILYAKGASSGHVLFVNYQNLKAKASYTSARVGHRGIGMWSMQTADLERVKRAAKQFGAPMRDMSRYSDKPAVVLTAPNNFQILIQQR